MSSRNRLGYDPDDVMAPGEASRKTVREIVEAARAGDPDAQKAWKALAQRAAKEKKAKKEIHSLLGGELSWIEGGDGAEEVGSWWNPFSWFGKPKPVQEEQLIWGPDGKGYKTKVEMVKAARVHNQKLSEKSKKELAQQIKNRREVMSLLGRQGRSRLSLEERMERAGTEKI